MCEGCAWVEVVCVCEMCVEVGMCEGVCVNVYECGVCVSYNSRQCDTNKECLCTCTHTHTHTHTCTPTHTHMHTADDIHQDSAD